MIVTLPKPRSYDPSASGVTPFIVIEPAPSAPKSISNWPLTVWPSVTVRSSPEIVGTSSLTSMFTSTVNSLPSLSTKVTVTVSASCATSAPVPSWSIAPFSS